MSRTFRHTTRHGSPVSARRAAVTVAELRREAADYYALCNRAAALGVPTSLDDPRSPRTVAALHAAVAEGRLS